MSKRTIREFQHEGDIWPVVEKWAGEKGYRFKKTSASGKLYQKGVGFLVAPMMCQVDTVNGTVHLQAWIRVNAFMRLMVLFLIPAEMGIESGGFRLALPRSMARKAVNELLGTLGQEPIP
ncbi:MAG: hypothetical protein ACE5G0_20480 [Rhodothermales bacterium]